NIAATVKEEATGESVVYSATVDGGKAEVDKMISFDVELAKITVAPRVVLRGKGDDAHLELTNDLSYEALMFQAGGVIGWSYGPTGDADYNPTNSPDLNKIKEDWNFAEEGGFLVQHTVEGLKNGIGDPCRLIGIPVSTIRENLNSGTLPDNKKWKSTDPNDYLRIGRIASDFQTVNGIKGRFFGEGTTTHGLGGTFYPATGGIYLFTDGTFEAASQGVSVTYLTNYIETSKIPLNFRVTLSFLFDADRYFSAWNAPVFSCNPLRCVPQ
ncbi:MAG: hypothetical protein ACRCZZ_04440, partial [Phocaeicola sp.]